jgi:hypothetical protein
MRLKNIPNLFRLNRYKKLREDFQNPITAFMATSGISSKKYTLVDKNGNKMQVNRDDLPIWSAYFEHKQCDVKIKNGLFYIIPHHYPSYYIKGANLGLTHQPERWIKDAQPLILELEKSEQKFFSQHGEDGVIQKILSKIPIKHQYLIEFGAHDGFNMSNSRYLITAQNWNALLIEGDSRFYAKLKTLYAENKNVITQKIMLTVDNINQKFQDANVPADFDFLCIDVDGPDYYLWEALTQYTPSIVMVEYNSIIAPDKEYIIPADKINEFGGTAEEGASLLSFYKLGKKKGYSAIYTELSGANLFFIHNKYLHLFNVEGITVETLYQPPQFGLLADGPALNGRGYA